MATTERIPDIQAGLTELYNLLVPEMFTLAGSIHITTEDDRVRMEVRGLDNKEDIRAFHKLCGGGRWTKEYTEWDYTEKQHYSANLTIVIDTYRSAVCTRVRVGTKTVTEPDRAKLRELEATVPTVTREEPVWDWDCTP